MRMKQATVAIIGAGAVGSTAAYALMMRGVAHHIMLVDINEKRCSGEVKDLSDAIAMSTGSASTRITVGTLKEAGQADIIVIAAGIPQRPGQSRLELLKTNCAVLDSLVKGMQPLKKESIIIVVTNPVDILTRYVQKISGLPRNQVFGSGTFLDTQRLRGCIAEKLGINPLSIHVYVLGEHGDSQFVAWSAAHVGGEPLADFKQLSAAELERMAYEAKNRAYEIIECKGFTSFSIGACIATYCENIFKDTKRVLPLSCFIDELGVCLSMPAVLGAQGVEQVMEQPLNQQEQHKLAASVKVLQENYASILP